MADGLLLQERLLGQAFVLGEMNWIHFVIYCGGTLAVLVVGIYLMLLVKNWMQTPVEYHTVGDDLESLREALKLGSIDEDEYRKAVESLQLLNKRMTFKEVEPLEPVFIRQALQTSNLKQEQPSTVEKSENNEVTGANENKPTAEQDKSKD